MVKICLNGQPITRVHIYIFIYRSERLTRMVEERRQLEYTMSWLSTLGGAFSALGDNFYHCVSYEIDARYIIF